MSDSRWVWAVVRRCLGYGARMAAGFLGLSLAFLAVFGMVGVGYYLLASFITDGFNTQMLGLSRPGPWWDQLVLSVIFQ